MARIASYKKPAEVLTRILDLPNLPELIQNLDAGVLTRVIRHVGLEDSGEIISLASPDQLTRVFDEDLFRPLGPGHDEIFDGDRFGLWLEIMVENGASHALSQLKALDGEMVVFGLSHHVRVEDRFAPQNGDGDRDNMPGARTLDMMFGRYTVSAKKDQYWDAILSLLAEFNEQDAFGLERLLARCCMAEPRGGDEGMGIDQDLSREQVLEYDMMDQRNERREERGFVTASSARAFLSRIRSQSLKDILQKNPPNFESRTWLRAMATESTRRGGPKNDKVKTPSPPPRQMRDLIQVLRQAEVLPKMDQPLLSEFSEGGRHPLPLANAMDRIQESNPDLYTKRVHELSFLSNTLIAGCGFRGRAFSPQEATHAVMAVCNLGSEVLVEALKEKTSGRTDPVTGLLEQFPLVTLFSLGWSVLFERVIIAAAKHVLRLIHGVQTEDLDPRLVRHVFVMRKILEAGIASKRPWTCLDRLDDLLMVMDGKTVATLKELMQEFPTVSEEIGHIMEPPLPPMISSLAHVRAVRSFLKKLIRQEEHSGG